jgi:hypothetical protein
MLLQKWRDFPEISSWSGNASDFNKANLRTAIREKSTEAVQVLEQVPIYSELNTPKRVYIPVLRGLRPVDEQHTDLYAQRTYSDYFPDNTKSHPEVFTGLSFYQRLTNMLLGDHYLCTLRTEYSQLGRNLLDG